MTAKLNASIKDIATASIQNLMTLQVDAAQMIHVCKENKSPKNIARVL